MYEIPDTRFDGLAMRFMDIRKRVYEVPELGKKAMMVAIPTTSGTGSEVTPFSVVTDELTGSKYPLADYALTPHMAIVDPQLVMGMPRKLTAWGGIDALTHALESYVSVCATGERARQGQAGQAGVQEGTGQGSSGGRGLRICRVCGLQAQLNCCPFHPSHRLAVAWLCMPPPPAATA